MKNLYVCNTDDRPEPLGLPSTRPGRTADVTSNTPPSPNPTANAAGHGVGDAPPPLGLPCTHPAHAAAPPAANAAGPDADDMPRPLGKPRMTFD